MGSWVRGPLTYSSHACSLKQLLRDYQGRENLTSLSRLPSQLGLAFLWLVYPAPCLQSHDLFEHPRQENDD